MKSLEYKINYDFVVPIKLIREEPKFEEGLTIEQYHKLVDAAVDYLKPIIEFGAYTGWRQSEITNLQRSLNCRRERAMLNRLREICVIFSKLCYKNNANKNKINKNLAV